MLPKLPREQLLELCRRMFVIRHFEENLVPLHDKEFSDHYHLYVGQEATGVWHVVPGSGTGELKGLAGIGGYRPPVGEVIQATLEYVFE